MSWLTSPRLTEGALHGRRLDQPLRRGPRFRLVILESLVGKPAHHREAAQRRRAADEAAPALAPEQQRAEPAERRPSRQLVLPGKLLGLLEEIAGRFAARHALERVVCLGADACLLLDRRRAVLHAGDRILQQVPEQSAYLPHRILRLPGAA